MRPILSSFSAAGDDARTFLIVGGGAAGEAAAETLRREGFAGRIVMVTAEDERPYDRPNLSKDLLTGKAKPEWMPLRGPKFHANQNIELITGRHVTAVDPAAKTVASKNGKSTRSPLRSAASAKYTAISGPMARPRPQYR